MESGSVYISSLRKPPTFKNVIRALTEGGILAGVAYLGLCLTPLNQPERTAALEGAGIAWVASAVGTVSLAIGMRSTAKAFWIAFGAGVFLRLLLLAAMAGYVWKRPWIPAPELLIGYALGVIGFVFTEYRHLVK